MLKEFHPGSWTRYVVHPFISQRDPSNETSQREKHYVFEDPKPSSSNIGATAVQVQEWLDALDRSREMASQQQSAGFSDDAFRDLSSGFPSPANTLDRSSDMQKDDRGPPSSGRNHLVKQQTGDTESTKGRKRFSKRHSKNGLAAVF